MLFGPKKFLFLKGSKNLDGTALISVVQSIREYFYPDLSESIRDRSPIHLSNKDTPDAEIPEEMYSSNRSPSPSVTLGERESPNTSPGACTSSPHSIQWTPIPTTPVNLSRQQPNHSITTPSSSQSVLEEPQGSIAELFRASPLIPLNVSFMRVLDDKVREDCLKELSNPNTSLSDVTGGFSNRVSSRLKL